MKNKILVSVIIPVYNGEKFLMRCLNSIINQTYKNLEIIVINDGSTDNTMEILNNISDERIIVKSIVNGGVSNARNIGIRCSKGKYIMFVDADDYIDLTTIEFLINVIKENNVDIIRYNGFIEKYNHTFDKLEFPIETFTKLDSTTDSASIIDIFNNPNKSLRCYSPLLFMKNENLIEFNTELSYLEDKVFYLENLLASKTVLFIDEPLYYYMYNDTSKTKKSDKIVKNFTDILESKKFVLEIVKKHGFNNEKLIDASYGILLLYRLEFFVGKMAYSETRKIITEVMQNVELRKQFNIEVKNINKIKKIQLFLLKYKMYYFYFLSVKLKNKIKN